MPEGQITSAQIRLVAGLGNPGTEYVATRHNIGFMVVDQFAAQFGSTWEKSGKWDALSTKCGPVMLIKPMSFMNRSGYPLFAVAQFYKIVPREILIVLDDFALPLGRLRLRARGGPGGHNGLESIIVQFGTEEIPRLRIGIGAAPREGLVDYVLSRFFEEEKPLVRSTIDRAVEAVKCAVDNGLVSAMNNFNPESSRGEQTKEV
jgi:PTH1 family peptidyl-tRNA hydrolase